jgi:hypothetical protein
LRFDGLSEEHQWRAVNETAFLSLPVISSDLERHHGCLGGAFHDEQTGPRIGEGAHWTERRVARTCSVV